MSMTDKSDLFSDMEWCDECETLVSLSGEVNNGTCVYCGEKVESK